MLKKLGLILFGCVALIAYTSCSSGGGGGGDAGGDGNGTYSVTYDANGASSGTVPVDSKSYSYDDMVYVKANPNNLTKAQHKFMGWSLTKTTVYDSSIHIFNQPDVTFAQRNITFFAVWAPGYSVTYSAPDATSGRVPIDYLHYDSKQSVKVLSNYNGLAKTGYVFSGWKDSVQGQEYPEDSSYTITEDVTFTACWTAKGSGVKTTHAYTEVANAEEALDHGIAAGTSVTDTSASAYKTTTTALGSVTVVYHLNRYTYNGLTLTGSITSVANTSPATTSMNGIVTITGGTVTKVVYSFGSTSSGTSIGNRKYTFTDGSTWTYSISARTFTQNED